MRLPTTARRAALVVPVVAAATLLLGTQTAFAQDESFAAYTEDEHICGEVEFVDYGPGLPGGGNNDDYLLIHDLCPDGKGVRAYAWVNGKYLGGQNNTSGYSGAPVFWDPFPNVTGGQVVGLKVCLFDTKNVLSYCKEGENTVWDG